MDSAIPNAIKRADRDVLRTLIKHYGSPEAAQRAIEDACATPENIEEWASFTQQHAFREERRAAEANGDPFFFSPDVDVRDREEWKLADLPEPLRQYALESTAGAMLAWEIEQQREM